MSLPALPSLPWSGPVPVPSSEAVPYFEGLRAHELRIARCRECGMWIHYPLASCPRCHSLDVHPEPVDGRGTLYSYTVVEKEFVPGIAPGYVAILVDLDAAPGARILSNLVHCELDRVEIGMPLQPVYLQVTVEFTLLYFEPAEDDQR